MDVSHNIRTNRVEELAGMRDDQKSLRPFEEVGLKPEHRMEIQMIRGLADVGEKR